MLCTRAAGVRAWSARAPLIRQSGTETVGRLLRPLVVEKVLREPVPLLLPLGIACHVLAPVVLRSQLRIRKDLVCLRDFLKFCLLVLFLLVRRVHGQFIRVVLECELKRRG